MADLVVTVRGTIMDGPVVSWFKSEVAAEDWRAAIVTASRNGVHIDCWLHDLPDDVLKQAREAWEMARRGAHADQLRARFATHAERVRSGLVPLTPVTGEAASP